MIGLPFKQNKESVPVELMEEINLFQNSNQSTNPKYHNYWVTIKWNVRKLYLQEQR